MAHFILQRRSAEHCRFAICHLTASSYLAQKTPFQVSRLDWYRVCQFETCPIFWSGEEFHARLSLGKRLGCLSRSGTRSRPAHGFHEFHAARSSAGPKIPGGELL